MKKTKGYFQNVIRHVGEHLISGNCLKNLRDLRVLRGEPSFLGLTNFSYSRHRAAT
jgi:hypothetical protein